MHTLTRVSLRPDSRSRTTAKGVTSAPVPEVVGMQMHSVRPPMVSASPSLQNQPAAPDNQHSYIHF